MAQTLTVLANQADHSAEAIDIKSVAVTSTMVNGACRLRTVAVTSAGTTGTAVFRDGGSGGAVVFTAYAAVNSNNPIKFPFPGKTFENDLHVTLANVTGVTISYH